MAKALKEEKLDLKGKIEELNKKYGIGSIISLNDKAKEYDVIPTGSITFDKAVLGVGGFVVGRMYELRGWEGVGKSTICGHLAASAQKKFPNKKVLYVDGEFSLDKAYFEMLGVDTGALLVVQPNNGEEGFTIAQELISTGEISVCIIDSDSSLLPKAVLEGEIGAANLGRKAKLNSDVYPKIKSIIAKYNTLVVVTSQYRQMIGMIYGDPKITQGGKALGFYADGVIEISKKLKKEGEETSGNITTVKTIKNKTYSPYKVGSFDVLFGIGIDKIGELITLGKEYEILKFRAGIVTYGEEKYNEDEFRELLESNDEFRDSIIQKIYKKIEGEEQMEVVLQGISDKVEEDV